MQIYPYNQFMKKYMFQKNCNFFYENRLIYFADTKDTGSSETSSGDSSENIEKADSSTKKSEISSEPDSKESEPDSKVIKSEKKQTPGSIQQEVMERHEKLQLLLDQDEYELPPDIDPARLSEARNNVNKAIVELNKHNSDLAVSISKLLQKLSINEQNAKQSISKVIYRHVPEYKPENPFGDAFEKYPEVPKIDSVNLVNNLAGVLSEKYGYDGDIAELEEFAQHHFVPALKKIAEGEWEMLKTAYTVKEFMWDVHDKIKPKLVEERMKKEISRYVGFPLKKGLILEGLAIKETPAGQDTYGADKYTQKWKVRDIYMNKEIVIVPSDDESSEKKIHHQGIWVEIESTDTGDWERMPMHRLKEFVEIHDIKPALHSLDRLDEVVPYLSHMGVRIEPGMDIEYDELVRDNSGKAVPKPRSVKIISLSDSGVKLDRKVTYRSKYDSPDLADHEMKDEMTLSEFAKWLNERKPLPLMSADDLQNKLEVHHSNMIKEYSLLPDCHRSIKLEPGEVIYADAPGNPLYRIEDVNADNGNVGLRAGEEKRQYTFPEFLRWVHQYGIEPYDPELQGKRAKRYLGARKKDLPNIRKKAKQVIENLNKTNNWRNMLNDLKQEGVKDISISDDDIIQPLPTMDAANPTHSGLREFLKNTTWLSLDDIFQLFKSCWEYYVNNWETKQKYRYSSVGKNIPWFGTEFDRINQAAESEYVNKFMDSMKEWSPVQIEETLYKTNNKDQAKACLITLSEKGLIRWNEVRLWRALNKFCDAKSKLPIAKADEDPYLPYKKGTKYLGQDVGGKTAIDLLPEVIDSIWGEQTYVSWRRQNDGAIEDGVQKAYNKGMELESDPYSTGGLSTELSSLLALHMNNKYVDPQEFEGLLRFMIEAGKGSHEDRIYFLLMGTTIKNAYGRTIMGWERMGTFISKLGNNFPLIDYFTDKGLKRDPKNPAKMINRAWIRSDFESLTQKWASTAKSDNYSPNADVREYLWKDPLTSEAFHERLGKAMQNAEGIDHDDTPLFIPALKDNEIENATSNSAGNKKKFSTPGYKNAYVGFGTRINYLMKKLMDERELKKQGFPAFESGFIEKMINTLTSFVRYDSILSSRYLKRQGNSLARLSDADYRSPCAFDPLNPIAKHQKQMQDLIGEILKEYNVAGRDEFKNIFTPPKNVPKNMQKKVEEDIKYFGERFYDLVSKDNGEKMLSLIDKSLKEDKISGLEGGPATAEEMARRKIQIEMKEMSK